MKLTLAMTREILRDAFGPESFVASFIKTVREGTACSTACIDATGTLEYHPAFVTKYVQSTQDLFGLVCHELMHPLFGHFVHGGGFVENLAADTFINAAISLVYAGPSGGGSLFKAFYAPHGLEGLLRPGSDLGQSRYGRLYDAFYSPHVQHARISTGEVIQTLKVLGPKTPPKRIVLLGTHPNSGGARGTVWSSETRARLAEDLKRAAAFNPRAGYGEHFFDFVIGVLNHHLSLKKTLLQRYETRRKVDRFLRERRQPRISHSPLPIRPSKRDLVLLGAGVPPFHYHNRAETVTRDLAGLAIYVDVSGSVHTHLPRIVGLLRPLRTRLKSVYLFSNRVFESAFEALLQGNLRTTGGTDFDCVAWSLLHQGYDKAVILTDGYARLDPGLAIQLAEARVETLTVLFGGKTECPEFAPFGPVVPLDELAE